MYNSTPSLTSALYGVGGQRHAPATLPPGKTRYSLYRRLGGPQDRSGRVRKISPPTGIRSPDRPSCSKSLYWLSYRGPQLCDVHVAYTFQFAFTDTVCKSMDWIQLAECKFLECENYNVSFVRG